MADESAAPEFWLYGYGYVALPTFLPINRSLPIIPFTLAFSAADIVTHPANVEASSGNPRHTLVLDPTMHDAAAACWFGFRPPKISTTAYLHKCFPFGSLQTDEFQAT